MSAPRTTTLFHFTKSLTILKNILKEGLIPRYSLEDVAWFSSPQDKAVAFPVVCFCDIPLGRITEHVNFYGQYGIGLKQEWGISNGLNPVIYVSETSDLAKLIIRLSHSGKVAYNADKNNDHLDNFRRLVGFCKPMVGQMIIQGNAVSKMFYQESEWRYLATHKDVPKYLKKDIFHDQNSLDRANSLAATHSLLQFSPQDVKYIFVQSESDIPELVNYINIELSNYPLRDVQTLITRIVSQDMIANDI